MKVEVNGKEYTLSKVKTGPMLKILPRLDGEESAQAQLEMVAACLGVEASEVEGFDFTDYVDIQRKVLEVNALGNEVA